MEAKEGAIVRHNASGDVGYLLNRKQVQSASQQGWWLGNAVGCAGGGLADRVLKKEWTVIAESIRDLADQLFAARYALDEATALDGSHPAAEDVDA